jgi:hypothetical protein
MATTAIGTLIPILLITLFLSTEKPLHEAGILLAFVALAVALALISIRFAWRGWSALERTFEASSQLAGG